MRRILVAALLCAACGPTGDPLAVPLAAVNASGTEGRALLQKFTGFQGEDWVGCRVEVPSAALNSLDPFALVAKGACAALAALPSPAPAASVEALFGRIRLNPEDVDAGPLYQRLYDPGDEEPFARLQGGAVSILVAKAVGDADLQVLACGTVP